MGTFADPSVARGHYRGPVRVFVVKNGEVRRQGLRDLLAGAGLEVVGECSFAEEAGCRIVNAGPDVVVLDGSVPCGTGIEVCRYALSADAGLQCLMMTSYVDDEVLSSVVLAGAAGYVLRQVHGNGLVEAVRRAAAGELLLGPDVAHRAGAWFSRALADPGFGDLTGEEREVLALISEGLNDRQISEALGLAEMSVRELVSSLLVKLGFGSSSGPEASN
jgi:two-component system response regulator DevR